MKYLLMLIVLIAIIVGIAVFIRRPFVTEQLSSSMCSKEYAPVCGIDNKTYGNTCEAEQARMRIQFTGACPTPSALTATERKWLLWLLRKRDEGKLLVAAVRHERTVPLSCEGCVDLFYSWGEPRQIVRISVAGNEVRAAEDTAGYDYLTQRQGSPVSAASLGY